MKIKYFSILFQILLISAKISAQIEKQKPRPDQKINTYWLEKDYTKTPYEDRLNYTHAGFRVEDFDMEKYTLDEWENGEKEFSGEDFYNVLVPTNEDTVIFFFFVLVLFWIFSIIKISSNFLLKRS